ncbi:hypothetical protein Tco_0238724, partial [Tanacetum coccineum]
MSSGPTDMTLDNVVSSSELSSMPDDDLHSVLAFDTIKSGDDDDMAYSRHMSKEGTTDTLFNAFAKYHSLSGHLDYADEVNKATQETTQSPDDTESEIKVVKSFFTSHLSEVQDQTMNNYEESAGIQEDSDSDLQSMPDDDLRSVSGFEAANSDDTHDNEVSYSAHTSQDDIASAELLSIPDHLDHICEEVNYLHS